VFLGLAGLVGGPVLFGGHGRRSEDFVIYGVLGGIGCLLLAAIWASATVSPVTPRRIDDRFVYLKKAGREFLNSLSQG
jgi:hypothetical protein